MRLTKRILANLGNAIAAQVLAYLTWCGLVLHFGGGDSSSSNSSSSSTSNTTTNIDKRQVVSDAGLGVSSDSSTVNVTLTDRDSVAKALDFAQKQDALAANSYDNLIKLTAGLFAESFKVIDKNQALVSEVSGDVKTAYEVAQSSVSGQRDQQKTLLIGGGLVLAYFIWGKR